MRRSHVDGCRVSRCVGDPGCNKGSSMGAARTYGDQGCMSSQCRGRGACILVGLTPVRQGRAQPMQTPSAPPLWLCVQCPMSPSPTSLPTCVCWPSADPWAAVTGLSASLAFWLSCVYVALSLLTVWGGSGPALPWSHPDCPVLCFPFPHLPGSCSSASVSAS